MADSPKVQQGVTPPSGAVDVIPPDAARRRERRPLLAEPVGRCRPPGFTIQPQSFVTYYCLRMKKDLEIKNLYIRVLKSKD
jgi:hypothetical protein